jgi:actin-related protein
MSSQKFNQDDEMQEDGYHTTYKTSASHRIILDNGSHKLRYAKGHDTKKSYMEFLNTVAYGKRNSEIKLGTQVESLMNENLYKYNNPHTRGVLTNFDTQMLIWNQILDPVIKENGGNGKGLSLSFGYGGVYPNRSKEKLLEVLFEFYGFSAVYLGQ